MNTRNAICYAFFRFERVLTMDAMEVLFGLVLHVKLWKMNDVLLQSIFYF
jgi:hypothetical protein